MSTADGALGGRAALVTGGASGIGAAVVERLCAAGASVVIGDVDLQAAQALAARLNASAECCTVVHTDVTQPAALDALVAAAVARHGGLQLAVNCAGVSGARLPLAEQSTHDWHRVIDHNLHGAFYAMRAEIPAMLASVRRDGAAIVNVASVLGLVGAALAPAYAAAKHGVIGMTRSAALAYADRGLRINAIAPGYIDTPLLAHLGPADREAVRGLHPVGRLGTAAEIADAILFLLSPASSFMTGAVLAADGGYTAR